MQGYIIYHNATINGNTTSVFVPSNSSLLFHEIEIPTECPGYWFEVSVAIVNVLRKGHFHYQSRPESPDHSNR